MQPGDHVIITGIQPQPPRSAHISGIGIRYQCGESFLAGWSTQWSIEPTPADDCQPPALICSLICHHCGRQHTFTFIAKEEIL